MRVLIVGAGYAGLLAALRLSRKDPSIAVTLVNPVAHFRERIRDHQWAVGAPAPLRPLRDLLDGTGVRLVVGRVVAVDRSERTATVALTVPVPMGLEERLTWDYLVVATGSVTDTRVPGARQHARALDGPGADAIAAELRVLSEKGGKIVVVGGGLTGIEIAAEVAEAFPRLDVELVAKGPIGEGFSGAARRAFARWFERRGVRLRPFTDVASVHPHQLSVRTGVDGEEGQVAFDVCLWAAGFLAAPLPEGLDVPVDADGYVRVTPGLASIGDPRVLVAGDGAAYAPDGGRVIPRGCKSAMPAGQRVADNLLRHGAGTDLVPFRFVTPVYCVSLGRKHAVVQRTAADGSPSAWVVSGRLGAWIKELICRATVWGFALERKAEERSGMKKPARIAAWPGDSARPRDEATP